MTFSFGTGNQERYRNMFLEERHSALLLSPSLNRSSCQNFNSAARRKEKLSKRLATMVGIALLVALLGAISGYAAKPPVASNDAYSTNDDTQLNIAAPGVLANDSDVDGDSLTAVLDTTTSNGTLTLNTAGSFSYTPDPDFNGIDTFTYTGSDGSGGTATATVTVTVTAVNDPPVAHDDSEATKEDTSVIISVLSNDSDPDGDGLVVK